MSFNLNVLIDGKLLSMTADSIPFKNLSFKANMLTNVFEISITEDIVILTTEYSSEDKINANNIDAYDYNGNHLWNIADIVGDVGTAFWGAVLTTAKLLELDLDCKGPLLSCTAFDNRTFIIDINSRKLLLTRKIKN